MSSESDNLLVGVIYMTSALLFITVNTVAVMAIVADKSLLKLPSYRIMTSMIVADNFQLLWLFIGGCVTATSNNLSLSWAKLIGGIPNLFWIANCIQGCILALTRCSAIFERGEHLFQGNRVYFWIFPAYLYGSAYFISYMTPDIDMLYFEEDYFWGYGNSTTSQLVGYVELASDTLSNAMMLLFYLALAVRIILTRTIITHQQMLTSKEIMAIVQSFAICFADFQTLLSWYLIPTFIPGKWASLACTLCWIVSSGTGGVCYLLLVKSVRDKVVETMKKLTLKNRVDSIFVQPWIQRL